MSWQFLVISGAVFKAGYDIILKKVLDTRHATETLVIVNILSLAFFLPFIFNINFAQDPKIMLILMLRTALFLTGDILFFKALRHSDMSVVTPFYNLSPVFLIFVSFLFLGEILTIYETAGIMLLVLGSFLLKNEVNSKDHVQFFKSKYFVYVMLALVFWSFSAVAAKYASQFILPFDMLFFTLLFASMIMLMYHSFMHDGILGVFEGFRINKNLLAVSAFLYVLFVYFLYTAMSIEGTKISLIVPVLRFSVFIDILIGGTLFHERGLLKRFAAAGVMLLGTIIILV